MSGVKKTFVIVKQVPAVLIYSIIVLGALAILVSVDKESRVQGFFHLSGCKTTTLNDYTSDEAGGEEMLSAINIFRMKNNKTNLSFSKEAYELAAFRAHDMYDFHYLAHTNPVTGSCSEDIKTDYRINGKVSESVYGESNGEDEKCATWKSGNFSKIMEDWTKKDTTKNNLLHDNNFAGAVACFKDKCVFIGINHDGFGNRCIG